MGKIELSNGRRPPRTFALQNLVIILVAWGTSVLTMTGAEVMIHAQGYSPYSEDLGVATFSGKLVAGLFAFLGTWALLERIMR